MKTPVAFLVFNRPDTTEQVFAQIAQVRPSQLLVVADGPRPNRPDEAEKCAVVRQIIERVDWPCEVLTNYADTNLGCKRRVSSGLDWVFDTVEEAIILEDDCVPHPTFFRFCEELLVRYRDDERVMMICGTNYLSKLNIPESYLFSRYFAVWGWASWKRAWDKYDFDMTSWPELKKQKQLYYMYPQRHIVKYFIAMFDQVYNNQIDTWDIQWFYSCLFNNGLSIVPKVNLISNIGVVGTHTLSSDKSNPKFFMPTFTLDSENLKHPEKVFANSLYDVGLFEKLKLSIVGRIKSKIVSVRHKLNHRNNSAPNREH